MRLRQAPWLGALLIKRLNFLLAQNIRQNHNFSGIVYSVLFCTLARQLDQQQQRKRNSLIQQNILILHFITFHRSHIVQRSTTYGFTKRCCKYQA